MLQSKELSQHAEIMVAKWLAAYTSKTRAAFLAD
jgi:hypothetical protein